VGCDRKTISRGIQELEAPEEILKDRIRKKGGGRKSVLTSVPDIDEVFLKVLKDHTAGDPMNEKVIWTDLTHGEIAEKMQDSGITISGKVVKQLLKKHGYVKRKAQKTLSIGSFEQRNEQFENIAKLRKRYEEVGNPIISVDTKKKEFLGNLYRQGEIYTTEAIDVFDHDFPYLADGIIIPHTIYDIMNNKAYVNIGTSKDTSEFACDSIRQWWYTCGQYDYPNATSILLLSDSGGSNSYRHYIFKSDLQELADEIGVEIRVAHYPPYSSKWNPVEHRVFPYITRSLQGVILKSYELVKELIEKTTTKKGLKVKAHIMRKIYQTKRKVADNFKETMRIIFDDYLGKLNYRAVPIAV